MAMSVKSVTPFLVSSKQGNDFRSSISSLLLNGSNLNSSSCSSLSFKQQKKPRNLIAVSASSETVLPGVVFHPFEEVKKKVLALPDSPQFSLARQGFVDECEAAINEQIK